jgi:hypothetical protein
MATTTADGLYRYDATVKGKTLLEHAQLLDEYLVLQFGWVSNGRLTPGQWGTDINVSRIASAIGCCDDTEKVAERIHIGWSKCFKFWLNSKPWLWNAGYKQPSKNPLSNHKMLRASSSYQDLDERQKCIYRQMAQYVLNYC